MGVNMQIITQVNPSFIKGEPAKNGSQVTTTTTTTTKREPTKIYGPICVRLFHAHHL
jgi:hypothetical protein